MTPLRSTLWIVASLYCIVGGSYRVTQTYLAYCKRRSSPEFYLSKIVQTGPQKEALKTSYLAELMHLSADHPVSYDTFHPQLAQQQLLDSPVIQDAFVQLKGGDTVYVDYTVRQPMAWLYDFENIGLDLEGVPFPISPFFTPKNLPQIYIGLSTIPLVWHNSLMKTKAGDRVRLALTLLRLFQDLHLQTQLQMIDVSKADAPTLGRREIVVVIHEQRVAKYLRLTPKNFLQELSNYQAMRHDLPPTVQTIDLRIPHLAFVGTHPTHVKDDE